MADMIFSICWYDWLTWGPCTVSRGRGARGEGEGVPLYKAEESTAQEMASSAQYSPSPVQCCPCVGPCIFQ